jgi:hypothetical protein
MYYPINIPFGGVMLFNVVKFKEGATIDDTEMEPGEMCNVVKESYGDDQGGIVAGMS